MDTKFQTSFIPKKPINSVASMQSNQSDSSGGLFVLFAFIVFVLSIAGAVFTYFLSAKLQSTQQQYQSTLKANEVEFNPALIQTLQRANDKINLAKGLLNAHLAPEGVFDIIAGLIAQNTTFTSLSYTAPVNGASAGAGSGFVQLSMSGISTGFPAIAFQSDVFGQSVKYGKNIELKNPVLSGVGAGTTGLVQFSFSTGLDSSYLLYSKILQDSLTNTSSQ